MTKEEILKDIADRSGALRTQLEEWLLKMDIANIEVAIVAMGDLLAEIIAKKSPAGTEQDIFNEFVNAIRYAFGEYLKKKGGV